MISIEELLKKCKSHEPITKVDLGISTSHDCPYTHDCEECDGKFCRGMYYVNKGGLTIFNTSLKGGKLS